MFSNKFQKKIKKFFRDPKLFFTDALRNRKPIISTAKSVRAKTSRKMTLQECNGQIAQFSKNYHVNSMKIGEEFFWPYLRNHLMTNIYATWRGRVAFKVLNPLTLYTGHFSKFPTRFRQKVKNDYLAKDHNDVADHSADIVFFVQHSGFGRIEIDGQIYHRLIDPVYEAALKVGSALKVELLANPNMEFVAMWEKYAHKSLMVLPPPFVRSGYYTNFEYSPDFYNQFKATFKTLTPVTRPLLHTIVDFEMHNREWLLELLRQLNPKVICVAGYHYQASLISAAHELGILTVDLQHGLQVGEGVLYNHHEEIPKIGYQAYPDYFAVWGEKEYQNILSNFSSKKHKPIYMGNPWLAKLESFPSTLSQEVKEYLHKEHLTGRVIGLIILRDQEELPDLYRQVIRGSTNNILWLVRHHPTARRIYTNADFGGGSNILIDEQIDKVIFSELFQYVDITLSEGSALAIEASYYGVKNIVFSQFGLGNYKDEIDKGQIHYIESAEAFEQVIDGMDFSIKCDTIQAFKKVDTVEFVQRLLALSTEKKPAGTPFVFKDLNAVESFAQRVSQEKEVMDALASSGDAVSAAKVFYQLRELLGQAPGVAGLYEAEQDYFKKEAKIFKKFIQQSFEVENANVVMVGDSLGLPRPNETQALDFKASTTTTWQFNQINQTELSHFSMVTWAQRYLTTEKMLGNWEDIVGNLSNKHLVVHLGLNDSSERIYLEHQRLGMDVLDPTVKRQIVEFGKTYRKEIIGNQYEFFYVSFDKFKNNIQTIINRAKSSGALSVTFVNIIAFPQSHEIDTPRSLENTSKFNSALKDIVQLNSDFKVNLIDMNSIVAREGRNKFMLSDDMHLSHHGHKTLAREILNVLTSLDNTKIYKVGIVGVGQLGSRHLQGLSQINLPVQVELVEPNVSMQKTASLRLKEMPSNEKIASVKYFSSVDELSAELDLVIVATNADMRAQVLKQLLEKKVVKNLILEKVLFQDLNDYDYFENLFKEKGIKVWVNHPRREFGFYDRFIADLRRSESLAYHVQGSNWGLACNGLHFLDHLLQIAGNPNVAVKIETADSKYHVEESKRQGCYEVFGTITGSIGNNSFSLTCNKNKSPQIFSLLTIFSDDLRLIVDEAKGKVFYAYKEQEWNWQFIDAKIVEFQSELTGRVAASILTNGDCRLPKYAEASMLHKPFVSEMQKIINSETGKSLNICPIS